MTDRIPASRLLNPRRSFLARVLSGAGALAVIVGIPGRLLGEGTGAESAIAHPGDDGLNELKGKHRTVFDMSAHKTGKPLAQAKNYLDGWHDAFGVSERDVNLVIGVHGDAIPVVLNDALWARYKLGEQYEVTDASTKSASLRNPFSASNAAAAGLIASEQSMEALQKRGVRFIVCMNTIAAAMKKLSGSGFGSPEEVHSAIMGGLMPGVMTVPAMVVALTQLQEHGLKYTKIAG